MNTYNLETFQKQVLEEYFKEHATLPIRARREQKKMTMDGAWNWMKSKLQKLDVINNGCAVTDNEWAYNEMLAYFAECEEGDTYVTEEEKRKAEEQAEELKKRKVEEYAKRQQEKKENAEARKVEADNLWQKHKERLERWQDAELMKIDIYRAKHKWMSDKTDADIRVEFMKEAMRKEKEDKKRQAEEQKRQHDKMMEEWKKQQLSFNF